MKWRVPSRRSRPSWSVPFIGIVSMRMGSLRLMAASPSAPVWSHSRLSPGVRIPGPCARSYQPSSGCDIHTRHCAQVASRSRRMRPEARSARDIPPSARDGTCASPLPLAARSGREPQLHETAASRMCYPTAVWKRCHEAARVHCGAGKRGGVANITSVSASKCRIQS
jgi:hypothetical protein